MITRIQQRTKDDCAICTVAMVMGLPFSYERVLSDRRSYALVGETGLFLPWWETYLRDNGFEISRCRFDGLYALPAYNGSVLGILSMDIPRLRAGHVVAVDEAGVIDPADGAPGHVPVQEYVASRLPDGVAFHDEWLAVKQP
jgi:hypothetical protein